MNDVPRYRLLLAENDAALANSLAQHLEHFGHHVTRATSGRGALRLLSEDRFDAIILERLLDDLDGLLVLNRLRQRGVDLPVIVISAVPQVADRINALDRGADDYLVKPVDAAELNARLHAIRRRQGDRSEMSDMLRVGEIVVSPSQHRAWQAGVVVPLTHLEFNLLLALARDAGSAVSRATLIERAWSTDAQPTSNLVDATIRRLRTRLVAPGRDDPIVAVRGVGYLLRS